MRIYSCTMEDNILIFIYKRSNTTYIHEKRYTFLKEYYMYMYKEREKFLKKVLLHI